MYIKNKSSDGGVFSNILETNVIDIEDCPPRPPTSSSHFDSWATEF